MKIVIEINLDSEHFHHDDGTLDHGQVSEAIWNIHDLISQGDICGIVEDDASNKVGEWKIS